MKGTFLWNELSQEMSKGVSHKKHWSLPGWLVNDAASKRERGGEREREEPGW